MTMMTISDLPMDLLSEIVRRVPLKSMRAIRLTCKKWNTLSKSRSFRKMHMCNEAPREQGESRMVALMDQNLHLLSVIVDNVHHPSIEIKGKLSCMGEQVKISKLFHYDGLLLCTLKDSFRLVVWNPYLEQTRWIEPPSYSFRWELDGWDMYKYALGYDHNKKSHKILRFMNDYLPKEGYLVSYEIYDFDSNLWRTLNIGSPQWKVRFCVIGVPLNGNTYWLASHKNSVHVCDCLVCFDFTTERFGDPVLPLPFTPVKGREVSAVLSCLKGDKLAVLLQFDRLLKLEIWVTDVIDSSNVSWSKFLTVNMEPIGLCMGLFIDQEKKVAMVFDAPEDTHYTLKIIGEVGFFREVDLPVEYRLPRLCSFYSPVCSHYAPSLVQIMKPPSRVDEETLDDEEHSTKKDNIICSGSKRERRKKTRRT